MGKKIKTSIRFLRKPNDWLRTITSGKGRTNKLLIICTVFIAIGAWLGAQWPFPCFWFFALCFLFIGVLGLWSIAYFSRKMRLITSAVAHQSASKKANFFYFKNCVDSAVYIIAPLTIVVMFGAGGCSMFGAMRLTPTLIWVLALFFFVVYISIIGYLQYIVLAIYIYNLAHGKGTYHSLAKSAVDCIPAQLDWVQNLTKLSHTYRSAFFTLGTTYIIAFGAFCWLPQMHADTTMPAFYILWGIIFLVIVLLFPVVSLLEHKWIKDIVEKLKVCYIEDLSSEKNLSGKSPSIKLSPSFQRLVQTLCVTQILNSKDYPLKSAWTTAYAMLLSIFNFAAAAATIIQQFPTFSDALLQIF